MPYGRRLLIAALILLPAACGFHLRGSQQLPPAFTPLYLDKDSMSLTMYRELRNALKTDDGQITENATTAASALMLASERRSRNVTSVDSQGRAREYILFYTVDFTLQVDGKALIDKDRIQLNRTLLFDPDTLLGVEQETSNIYDDMIHDAAGLILLKVQAAGRR
jgi:LPS-assembly lipoprotein